MPTIPLEAQQRMIGHVIRNLDLLAHCVSSRNTRVATVQRCIVDALTFTTLKSLTGEPIITVTSIALAIGAKVALLSINIGAWKNSLLKAFLSLLLFLLRRNVLWVKKLVHQCLILANAPTKHASMVAIVVNAPLDVNNLASLVSRDGRTPVWSGLVVVDAHASVVTTWARSSHLSFVKIWERVNWFKNGAFRACVGASL